MPHLKSPVKWNPGIVLSVLLFSLVLFTAWSPLIAQDRFPRPEFETNYQLPKLTTPRPRALALEYARKGVTVNAVCPGYTNTELIEKAIDNIVAATGRSRDEALAEMINDNPQRRLIEPEEVAATVMWICQQESITGQAIAVAGGEVM